MLPSCELVKFRMFVSNQTVVGKQGNALSIEWWLHGPGWLEEPWSSTRLQGKYPFECREAMREYHGLATVKVIRSVAFFVYVVNTTDTSHQRWGWADSNGKLVNCYTEYWSAGARGRSYRSVPIAVKLVATTSIYDCGNATAMLAMASPHSISMATHVLQTLVRYDSHKYQAVSTRFGLFIILRSVRFR